jgi:tetratricopeptide (TPR) repeat protein
MNKALAQMYLRKFEDAVNTYTEIIMMQPGNSEAYTNRGVAKQYLEKPEEACRDWKKAVDLGNGKARSYISRYCKK